ncbi:MAG: hypothetical protein NXH88_17345, partial [Hyphomonas sp.]|nr:hypothetical protein [Hyphomonas sp.]
MAKQRDKNRSKPVIPAQPREDRLPSWTIPEDRFENACLDLARIEFPSLRPELKETKGAKQYEVDVECFDDNQEPVVVIQCKKYKDIKPSQYIRWVELFIDELDGHWKDRGVQTYVLAVTVEGNREQIKEKTREAAKRLKKHGIKFSPWFDATLTDLFRRDLSLVHRYFHPAWVNAISAKTPVSLKNVPTGAEAGSTVGLSQLSDVIALSDQIDRAVEQALDALEREAKAGNSARLRQYLIDQQTSGESWKRVGPATRARMLRRLMMFAVDDGDLPNAEALFEEAKSLAPSKDKTSEAHLVRLKSGLERAINFLEGAGSDAEKELLAGFYIVADMNPAAEKLLLSLPETAERERLAALVYLGAHNRQIALQRAQRAVELKPESYGTKLVLLLAHFNNALIDGVQIDFTAAPNPFNPVVVRADNKAREHMDRGLELVEQLLATTAGRVRSDLEVWKLVLLICHPDRRSDVGAYAGAVLNSDRPSPMFIVWALSIGLQLRTGKLRKYLEDEVRRGRGDATNVVVAALLLKDKDGNAENAIRLIEKYHGRWSDADDYLDEWRDQLSGNSQLIVAIDNHSSDEFDRLADEALNRSADRSFQLTAAQVLNDRQAYQQVLRLEECLLAIGNASSILILAEAKIEAGFPDQAAKLLELNKAVFGGAQLPLSALRLQAMAADRAGKFGSTLKALVRLEERAPNPVNQVQILQRARVIKDASTIKLYARKLVDQQKVDGFGRLIAADAVAPHDVELAQTLLEKFIAADDANPMAATKIWELANTYGMRRVADSEAFQELFQDALRNGPHVIQFDDVHQAIAHIEQMNVAQRELREKWLLGHTPTHAAFGSDRVAFVEMFLSEKTEVITMNGDQYPRIIEAAGLPDRPNLPALENSKPLLLLDLSALLLASRYGLLEAITRTFQCHVPRTMIPALEDFRDQIHRSKALDDDIRQRIMLAEARLRGLARKSGQNVEEISVERTLPGKESSASTIEFVEALGRA